jgi:hypothetical protein
MLLIQKFSFQKSVSVCVDKKGYNLNLFLAGSHSVPLHAADTGCSSERPRRAGHALSESVTQVF